MDVRELVRPWLAHVGHQEVYEAIMAHFSNPALTDWHLHTHRHVHLFIEDASTGRLCCSRGKPSLLLWPLRLGNCLGRLGFRSGRGSPRYLKNRLKVMGIS